MDRLQYLYINIPARLKDKLQNTEIQYNTTETAPTLNSTNINTTSTSNDVNHSNTKALEADKDASVVISSSSSVVVVDDVEKVLDLPSIKVKYKNIIYLPPKINDRLQYLRHTIILSL